MSEATHIPSAPAEQAALRRIRMGPVEIAHAEHGGFSLHRYGEPLGFAQLSASDPETGDSVTLYADDGTWLQPLPAPLTADANGRFPPTFAPPRRCVLTFRSDGEEVVTLVFDGPAAVGAD